MKRQRLPGSLGNSIELPGVMCGPLNCRELEKLTSKALKEAKGNFDASMPLSQSAKAKIMLMVLNA